MSEYNSQSKSSPGKQRPSIPRLDFSSIEQQRRKQGAKNKAQPEQGPPVNNI